MDHSLPFTCLLSLLRSVQNFDHNTNSPRNPRSNGQEEAAVKIIKGLQDKTPILPCWHIGAHPFMPTSVHQLRCYTKGPSAPHYHKGSITMTHMLQMTMIDLTNMPLRVQSTTTITADPSPLLYAGQAVYVSNNDRTYGSQPRSSVKLSMASTLYRL